MRWARPGDAKALSCIYDESWRGAYQGLIPHIALMRILARRGVSMWRRQIGRATRSILVIDYDGETVGYAQIGASRSKQYARRGEIFELYILPVYQGLGLGGLLFDEARRVLDGRNYCGLLVWALADNELADVFYRRKGGRPASDDIEHFSGHKLRKRAYLWPS